MFKAPFYFHGRIARTEYALSLVIWSFFYGLGLVLVFGGSGAPGLVLLLPAYWFLFAQGAKRCHDIGQNGWIQLVPIINPIVLLLVPGNPGRNQYGADPRSPNVPVMPAASPPTFPVRPSMSMAETRATPPLPRLKRASFCCNSCGAQNKDIPYDQTPNCEYCGSPHVKK